MFLIIMIRRGQESAGGGLADCMIDADMSWLRKGIVAGMVALAFVSARAQTPLASSKAGLKAGSEASSEADPGSESPLLRAPAAIQQAYAQARPYIDDPIAELKDAVPALKGIKAESSQDSLSFLLSRTGEVVYALLPKVPNLAAREELSQVSLPLSGGPATQQVLAAAGRSTPPSVRSTKRSCSGSCGQNSFRRRSGGSTTT